MYISAECCNVNAVNTAKAVARIVHDKPAEQFGVVYATDAAIMPVRKCSACFSLEVYAHA